MPAVLSSSAMRSHVIFGLLMSSLGAYVGKSRAGMGGTRSLLGLLAVLGAGGAGFVRFRTTSQNYYAYDTKALAVGESNQGIVSEKSKWIHQKQTM